MKEGGEGISTLSKEILIDIGDSSCIGINARFAGVDGGELGCARSDHGGDTRLNDTITPNHSMMLRIENSPVQGMRDHANHLLGGIARKHGIGIECHDISGAFKKGQVSHYSEEVLLVYLALIQIQQELQNKRTIFVIYAILEVGLRKVLLT